MNEKHRYLGYMFCLALTEMLNHVDSKKSGIRNCHHLTFVTCLLRSDPKQFQLQHNGTKVMRTNLPLLEVGRI